MSVPELEDEWLDGISLVVQQSMPVVQLPGFSKGKHRVPVTWDRRALEFVARLGKNLVRDDLDATYASFRTAMGLKRRQLEVTDSGEGFGSIQTPFFLYSNSVSQCEHDPSQALWRRELSKIVSAEVTRSEGCNQLFQNVFDTVEVVPSSPISLEKLIDHVEDLADEQVAADYDRELTYCRLCIAKLPFRIDVMRDLIRIVQPEPASPQKLLHYVQDFRRSTVAIQHLW